MIKSKAQGQYSIFKNLKIIIFSVFLFACCLFLIIFNVQISQKRKILLGEIKQLGEKYNGLSSNTMELMLQVDSVSGGSRLEEIARENFNLKKQGENVVAFPSIIEQETNGEIGIKEREDVLEEILKKEKP